MDTTATNFIFSQKSKTLVVLGVAATDFKSIFKKQQHLQSQLNKFHVLGSWDPGQVLANVLWCQAILLEFKKGSRGTVMKKWPMGYSQFVEFKVQLDNRSVSFMQTGTIIVEDFEQQQSALNHFLSCHLSVPQSTHYSAAGWGNLLYCVIICPYLPEGCSSSIFNCLSILHRLQEETISITPRLFECSNKTGKFLATEITNFTQDDLEQDDVFLLDAWEQVGMGTGRCTREKGRHLSTVTIFLSEIIESKVPPIIEQFAFPPTSHLIQLLMQSAVDCSCLCSILKELSEQNIFIFLSPFITSAFFHSSHFYLITVFFPMITNE